MFTRRQELIWLIFIGLLSTFGGVLMCWALHQSPLRALRLTAVSAGFIVASFLLQIGGTRRDYLLLPLVGLLCTLGLLGIWALSPVEPLSAAKQILWMLLGLAAMTVVYLAVEDVRDLGRYKYVAGVSALALLLLTMAFGIEKNGARLWLGWPDVFVFQPTELAKVLMGLFLAGYVAEKGEIIQEQVRLARRFTLPALKYIGPLLLIVLFFLGAFVLQRDLGAAALFFGLFVAVIYIATGRKIYPFLGLLLFALGAYAAWRLFPHVQTRFTGWTNPWADPTGKGYQILQGLFALAAGGMTGVGLGRGFPELIPAGSTDMIFPVIGEQLGLLGGIALLLLYVLIITRSFYIALRCRYQFGMLLAACLAIVFAWQTLLITGGVLRLIPLTGLTMPFVSYGGTSLVSNFIALGLLLVVSREAE